MDDYLVLNNYLKKIMMKLVLNYLKNQTSYQLIIIIKEILTSK